MNNVGKDDWIIKLLGVSLCIIFTVCAITVNLNASSIATHSDGIETSEQVSLISIMGIIIFTILSFLLLQQIFNDRQKLTEVEQ